MIKTPVLLIVFNRPHTTRRVLDSLRIAKPKYLFVVADGPRTDKDGEKEKCGEVRALIKQNIDWECEVKTLFRETNLGCGRSVSSAITWFFEQVEEGIILEDDCLPDQSFFTYCSSLLDYYRNESKVMFIGGANLNDEKKWSPDSYYFSAIAHVWGWATWKRTWSQYVFDTNEIPERKFRKAISNYFKNKDVCRYWLWIFNKMRRREIDTWDYQLGFSIWVNGGLSVVPSKNLVSNVGFGEDATHTTSKTDRNADIPVFSIVNIIHPKRIAQCSEADESFLKKENCSISRLKYLKKWLRGEVSRS